MNFPGRRKLPLDYMVVEVIFSELFALPAPKYVEICYGSLLLELCKLQPGTLPLVVSTSNPCLFKISDSLSLARAIR